MKTPVIIPSEEHARARHLQPRGLADVHPALSRAVDSVLRAQEDPTALRQVLDRSAVPMLTVDRHRGHTHVNRPARLLARKPLDQLLELRLDDFTPPEHQPRLLAIWNELLARGSVSGDFEVGFEDGTRLGIVYWALAEPCPSQHLAVFAPAGWPDEELSRGLHVDGSSSEPLTERELEVLRLVASGGSARGIAERLFIAESTVKTHLTHIYAKLEVRNRASAVARAMRLGLID